MSTLLTAIEGFDVSFRTLYVFDTAGRPKQEFASLGPSMGDYDYFGRQGFAWRPPVVAFYTMSFSESSLLQIYLAEEVQYQKDAFQAVQLPFHVSSPGEVAFFGPLGEPFTLTVPPGDYALVYEMKFAQRLSEEYEFADPFWDRDPHCRLTFVSDRSTEAKILQYNPQYFRPRYPLVMGFETFEEAHRREQLRSSGGLQPNVLALVEMLRSDQAGYASWRAHNPHLRPDLRDADLSGFMLVNVNLREANLRGANLQAADLRAANLHDTDLQYANLSQTELQAADLRVANLQYANLWEANLREANMGEASLMEADLSSADLTGADLRGATLKAAKISDTTQIDRKWRLVWQLLNLEQADKHLPDCDLSDADLSEAELQGFFLLNANLSRVNLRAANLSSANLSSANLSSANLRGANLQEANLQGADLSGANLTYANLGGADLRGANLHGANFEGVVLSDQTQLNDRWRLVWQLQNQGGPGA